MENLHHDDKISEAIITLLSSNVGYSIEFFGRMFVICQLEDLTFAVRHQKFNSELKKFEFDFEKIFTDVKEATNFFLRKRREFEIGYDFEIEKTTQEI
jgi:hypothetical protein